MVRYHCVLFRAVGVGVGVGRETERVRRLRVEPVRRDKVFPGANPTVSSQRPEFPMPINQKFVKQDLDIISTYHVAGGESALLQMVLRKDEHRDHCAVFQNPKSLP